MEDPFLDEFPAPGQTWSPMLNKHGLASKQHSMEETPLLSRASLNRDEENSKSKGLLISFVAMVVVGLGNKVFQKLQTIPMHNYSNFLNLLATFCYIPISFAYIIPMIKYGKQITPEQRAVKMKTFMVMGGLDSLAGVMQIFAATYLDGALLILLSQSAIPISMVISKFLLKAKYIASQYVGALVVAGGISVVLVPRLTESDGSSDIDSSQMLIWAMVMIFSCVPMTLSSVYKEKALGATELDPIYLNGWIAVWQFVFSIPIAIPAAIAASPSVYPADLPANLYDGLKCYVGINSVMPNTPQTDNGMTVDNCFPDAPTFVTIYLVFNIAYNILIILILKYGSSNILWLAMTIMVPLGSMSFSFDFVPGHAPAKITDVIGLVIILSGLLFYRFGARFVRFCMGPQ